MHVTKQEKYAPSRYALCDKSMEMPKGGLVRAGAFIESGCYGKSVKAVETAYS